MRGLLSGVMAVVALVMGVATASAQTLRVPDNEDILVRTIDIASPYYLDNLLAKYIAR